MIHYTTMICCVQPLWLQHYVGEYNSLDLICNREIHTRIISDNLILFPLPADRRYMIKEIVHNNNNDGNDGI